MSSSSPSATYDVVVIGAGPGGYVCAFRAAQLGLAVQGVGRRQAEVHPVLLEKIEDAGFHAAGFLERVDGGWRLRAQSAYFSTGSGSGWPAGSLTSATLSVIETAV